MKRLFLVRHAKSDWSIDGQKDIDRPLNSRGYSDAHKMGKQIFDQYGKPDLIISSSAIRALSTALIFCDEITYPKSKIKIDTTLYESTVEDYLSAIKKIEKSVNSAMVFGHNPVLSDLSMQLSRSVIDLPTCSIAVFDYKTDDWSHIKREFIDLKELKTPKTVD